MGCRPCAGETCFPSHPEFITCRHISKPDQPPHPTRRNVSTLCLKHWMRLIKNTTLEGEQCDSSPRVMPTELPRIVWVYLMSLVRKRILRLNEQEGYCSWRMLLPEAVTAALGQVKPHTDAPPSGAGAEDPTPQRSGRGGWNPPRAGTINGSKCIQHHSQ